ncbi:MAG: hypothetical protein ACETWK_05350 [Candidatus Aminicenantaceae bacterium]
MLSIDGSVIVIFIIIWILVYVLSKLFFNRVRGLMAKREATIRENRESCKIALQTYEQKINEIEESLQSAKTKSDLTIAEFENKAFKEKVRMLEEIEEESKKKVDEAEEQLKEHIKNLKKELEKEAKLLSERIEQKFLH